jgi:hypothetical protein
MTAISTQQVRAIHSLKAKAGLGDDDAYRDFLEQLTGSRSSKGLTHATAGVVLDRLKVLAGQKTTATPAPVTAGALNLSGPYAGICRALWISGYELGVFAHREDTALAAFVKRQTKLDSLNWLRDPEPARSVIEALKGWIAREAGVVWPGRKATPSQVKQAVIHAQQRLLGEMEIVVQGDLDAAIRVYGARVRAKKGAQ